VQLRLAGERQQLQQKLQRLADLHPRQLVAERRRDLQQALALLRALSPQHLLDRGFSLVRDEQGQLVRSVQGLKRGQPLLVQFADGQVSTDVREIQPSPAAP
jgi:exodeoxyribonuclease VII large subunit